MTDTEIIHLAKIVGKLKRVKRTGWVTHGIKDSESVAEHSYRVAFLAMLLAEKFELDSLKLVKMALVHDIGETVTGDVVCEEGTQITGSKEDKHRNEEKAVGEIFGIDESLKEYESLWKEFEDQKTEEAKFLKALDKLEMAIQALEYQEEGNPVSKLQLFWDNSGKHLNHSTLSDLFETLKTLR